jgi:DMSO/TMAO reductase YedYZ heme-binding membrane subunit
MNLLALAVGAPVQAAPNLGAWGHFLWMLVIVALIIFVVWWGWSQISARVPEPLRTVFFILGIVALVLVVVYFILIPLMGVF